MLVIKGREKSSYLTGSIPTPPCTAANYGLWEVENSTIMAWLINSIEPKIGRTYHSTKHPRKFENQSKRCIQIWRISLNVLKFDQLLEQPNKV